jgi:hypothetical protein
LLADVPQSCLAATLATSWLHFKKAAAPCKIDVEWN